MFTEQLTKRLMRLTGNQWRSLRAEVRWHYMHYEYEAPKLLSDHMVTLPEDSTLWRDYANDVTRKRRAKMLKEMYAQQQAKRRKEKSRRAEYQREYMRLYRSGGRRK